MANSSQSNQDLPYGGGFLSTCSTVKIVSKDIPIPMEDIVDREKSTTDKESRMTHLFKEILV